MQVIPQEFESVLQTSKRYQGGRNCPPTDIWKLVKSIDKLKSRPYLDGETAIQTLLSDASKSYQEGLDAVNNRVKYRLADTTKFFAKAAEMIQSAFNIYCAQKDIASTNATPITVTPDVLKSAGEVHTFLDPYYGDFSNKVKRQVRFVEKTDNMPVIYNQGIASGSVRPASFGSGWEAWIATNDNPGTIWIIARTGNAFDSDKDIISFIRQYFPNTTFYTNTILFAREMANMLNEKSNPAPIPEIPVPTFNSVMDGNVMVTTGQPGGNVMLSGDGKSFLLKKNFRVSSEDARTIKTLSDRYQEEFNYLQYIPQDYVAAKGAKTVILKALAKTVARLAIEIIGWTAISTINVSLSVLIMTVSKLVSLFKAAWVKIRLMILNHDIELDPEKEQTALHEFIQYEYKLEESSEYLSNYADDHSNRAMNDLKRFLRGLGQIISRANDYLQEEIMSDNWVLDPMSRGGSEYRSFEMNASKGMPPVLAAIIRKASEIIAGIKRIAEEAFDLLIKSGAIGMTVRTLSIILVDMLQLLNDALGIGLDIAEDALKSQDLVNDTDRLVDLLSRMDPTTAIDAETIRYMQQAYQPIFNRIKYFYSHPKEALGKLYQKISYKDPSQIRQNGVQDSRVYNSGGAVTLSNRDARQLGITRDLAYRSQKSIDINTGSLMDSYDAETSMHADSPAQKESNSEPGYTPIPFVAGIA